MYELYNTGMSYIKHMYELYTTITHVRVIQHMYELYTTFVRVTQYMYELYTTHVGLH